MNQLYSKLLVAAAILLPLGIFAQSTAIQNEKCAAHSMFLEQMAADPNFRIAQQNLEVETQQYVNQRLSNNPSGNQRNASVLRIIPVVFHFLRPGHEYPQM